MNDDFLKLATDVANNVDYKPGFSLLLRQDQKILDGRWYYQVEAERRDVFTGVMGFGYGGKAYLSEHMVESELVRISFGLLKAYEEHECREWYRYKGKAIFGPHISVDAMLEIADRLDFRE